MEIAMGIPMVVEVELEGWRKFWELFPGDCCFYGLWNVTPLSFYIQGSLAPPSTLKGLRRRARKKGDA